MGSKQSKLEEDLKNIKNQLTSITNIKAGDGAISKNDFNKWQKEQDSKMLDLEEKLMMKYSKIVDSKNTEINDMKKQIEALQSINHALESKLMSKTNVNQTPNYGTMSDISKQKIEEFVNNLMNDENVNIKYIPDFVEKQIYRNIFSIMLSVLDNVLETSSIKLMGHEIVFNLKVDDKINKYSDKRHNINDSNEEDTNEQHPNEQHTNEQDNISSDSVANELIGM